MNERDVKFKIGDRVTHKNKEGYFKGIFVIKNLYQDPSRFELYRDYDKRFFLFLEKDLYIYFELVKNKFYLDI